MELDDIVLEGCAWRAGLGEINYDGGINFRFNAGPLADADEPCGLGHALGFVTDRLVTYQVTGTQSHQIRWTLARAGHGRRSRNDSSTAGSGQ